MADDLSYSSIVSDIDSGKIMNLYLFYGPETLLINDVIFKIKKKLINPAFESLNVIKLDGTNIDNDTIINACETLPFMDEKKIVIIYECSFFKPKKSGEDADSRQDAILKYIEQIPESTVLIMIGGEEVDKRKKIYNLVKKKGAAVEFGLLKNAELTKWITNTFAKYGKIISNTDSYYLAERVSGSLKDIQSEIEKLCAYAMDKSTISRSDIDAVVPKSLEMNIFKLVDSVAQRSPGPALMMLNELLLDGESIPLILAMIVRQYRLLLNAKLLKDKGYSSSEITKKMGLNPYAASKILGLLKNYTEEQIENKLEKCLETDSAIKTGKMDQRLAIETLIVEFAK